jgi:adenosylmethionine-8-amino-7-oxononanoate aminotransferase
MNLSEKDRQFIWHPYTPMKSAGNAITVVKGEGAWLYDDTGKKYLDAVSSWWVNLHGHAHPYIAEKVSEQLKNLEHVLFAGFTHKPAVDLAETLLRILPGNFSKIFYSDNGSTAVEVAIKMTVQYWYNRDIEKSRILVFDHAYHGDTFGSMSVSGRGGFTKPYSSLLFDVIQVPFPQKGKEGSIISYFRNQVNIHGDKIAAFIFEPLILGAGGMLMYEASLLDQLIHICRTNNIFTIADEVMTGFGRTGKLFACEHLKENPDIICLSKGITGGTMALGVTACNQKISDAFLSDDLSKTFFHGHSYTANPLACTAANASLDLLLTDECFDNIQRIANQHSAFVKRNQEDRFLKNLRSLGTILAVDIATNEQTSYFNSQRDKLYDFFIEKGIILRPLGNTIYCIPPYCISNEDLEEVYLAIKDSETLFQGDFR